MSRHSLPMPTSNIVHIVLFLGIILQAALTLSYSITLHYELKTSGLDGTVYEQLMQNFIDGHDFTSSINPPYIPQHWLGFHFSPILYLIIPIYYFFPHIETLLTIGSVSVALAAYPLFLTARAILENSAQALLIALIYLCSPFVVNGTLWDFHEIDLAPLCIGWMLWAVVHKRPRMLLVLSLVLMCIKEHYGLSVAGFGILWAWTWRDNKAFGFRLVGLGLAMLWFIFAVVIPEFNPMGKPNMMNTTSTQDRFGWLMSEDGINTHLMPILTGTLWYVIKLLGPLMLLPLGSFMWLFPAIADASANMLSQEDMMRSHISYHTIALMPVVLIATCQSLKTYGGRWRVSRNDILLAVVVTSCCWSYMLVALPLSDMGNVWEFAAPRYDYTPEDKIAVERINALVPHTVPVSSQNNILPHLAIRYKMYLYPLATNDANFIVLNLAFPYKRALTILGTPYGADGSFFSNVDYSLHDPDWSVVYYFNRWVVLQKGGVDNPKAHQDAIDALGKLRDEYQLVRDTIQHSHAR